MAILGLTRLKPTAYVGLNAADRHRSPRAKRWPVALRCPVLRQAPPQNLGHIPGDPTTGALSAKRVNRLDDRAPALDEWVAVAKLTDTERYPGGTRLCRSREEVL